MKTTQSAGPEGGQAGVGGEVGDRVEAGSSRLTQLVQPHCPNEERGKQRTEVWVWLLRQGAWWGEDRARPSARGPGSAPGLRAPPAQHGPHPC